MRVLREVFLDVFFEGVASETIEPRREYGDNGEEVIDELLLWRGVCMIENHDLPIGAGGKDGLEEVKTESRESILVGNHNFSEISFDCLVQKGLKAFSFEVEA